MADLAILLQDGEHVLGESHPAAGGIIISGEGTDDSVVQGNYVGTDVTGTTGVMNLGGGVRLHMASGTIVGGASAGEGNVLSGNRRFGLRITGPSSGSVVRGNKIGTDVTGSVPVAGPGTA